MSQGESLQPFATRTMNPSDRRSGAATVSSTKSSSFRPVKDGRQSPACPAPGSLRTNRAGAGDLAHAALHADEGERRSIRRQAHRRTDSG